MSAFQAAWWIYEKFQKGQDSVSNDWRVKSSFFAASFCLRFVVDAATNQFWLHMGASVPEAYIGRGFKRSTRTFDHRVSFDIRLNIWSSGNKWKIFVSKRKIRHSCLILNRVFCCKLSRSSVLVGKVVPKVVLWWRHTFFWSKPSQKKSLVQVEWRTAPIWSANSCITPRIPIEI